MSTPSAASPERHVTAPQKVRLNKKPFRAKRPASLRVGGRSDQTWKRILLPDYSEMRSLDGVNKNNKTLRSPRPAHAAPFDPSRLPDKAETTITLNHPRLCASKMFPPLPEQVNPS